MSSPNLIFGVSRIVRFEVLEPAASFGGRPIFAGLPIFQLSVDLHFCSYRMVIVLDISTFVVHNKHIEIAKQVVQQNFEVNPLAGAEGQQPESQQWKGKNISERFENI